jgi:PASTA domain
MQESPQQTQPEAVIRRYLDENGGSTDATLEHLLVSFGVSAEDVAARLRIEERLAAEGVIVEPDLAGLGVDDAVRVELASERHRFPEPTNGQSPEEVIRSTVRAGGGSFRTDVPSLLRAFGRKQLTSRAREEIAAALDRIEVRAEPHLSVIGRHDPLYLFLAGEEAPGAPAPAPAPDTGSEGDGSTPWQTWAVSAILVAVVLAALIGGLTTAGVGGGPVAVPELVGLSADAAERRLEDIDLSAGFRRPPDDPRSCEVVFQSVEPGVDVDDSTTILLRCRLAVPDVTGDQAGAARGRLAELGFRPRLASNAPAGALGRCEVVRQSRTGVARRGTRVALRVAC